MQSRLTLKLERKLVERAKVYAANRGKTVSQLVADYFNLLDSLESEQGELPPLVRSLKGRLRGTELSEEDYQRHLEDKYL